jgi:hypothetical protein
MRLLLVTATAGISEGAMANDNVKARLAGNPGAKACETALESEKDAYRRVQLGLAKAIHLGEEKQWDAAVAAARAAPEMITQGSTDKALARTAKAASHYVEAVLLARAGRHAESEAAAIASIEASRFEVVGLQRALRLLGLDRTMSPAKAAAIAHVSRLVPIEAPLAARLHAEAGDYRGAAALLEGLETALDQFLAPDKRTENAAMLSKRAFYVALSGDASAARTLLTAARKEADEDAANGDAAKYPAAVAESDEYIGATEVALALAEQRMADARRLFAARERWALIPAGVTAALTGRIAATVPAAERTGLLAKGEDAVWADAREGRIKLMAGENDLRLWLSQAQLQVDARYAGATPAVWSVDKKPKMLVKGKADARVDFLSSGLRVTGIPAGEALLLHAALIAQQRQKPGFIVFPLRGGTDMMGVRFVEPSELGAGSAMFVTANEVISGTSNRFVRPVAKR